MNLVELYEQIPVERHHEIVLSGDRIFFDGEEYVVQGDGELKLIRSDRQLKEGIKAIKSKLGVLEL